MLTREEKIKRIETRRWFHSIEIEEGLVTPGRTDLEEERKKWLKMGLPERVDGLSVLDIGAWDGFYSFEAERRGAKRVVACDVNPPDYKGFAVARELLNSQVEYLQASVYDLSPELHGTFDIVLFLGVLYHLRYPLLALDKISAVTSGYAIVETQFLDHSVVLRDGEVVSLSELNPQLDQIGLYQFFRRDELNPGDYTNWFVPNRKALEDSLWSAGFRPEFVGAVVSQTRPDFKPTQPNRIHCKAVKLDQVPEYKVFTYDGTMVQNPDGTFTWRNPYFQKLDPSSPTPFAKPPRRSLAKLAIGRIRRYLHLS